MTPSPEFLELHRSLGAQLADRPGGPAVARYGDPEREYRALVEGCAICDRSGRGLIRVGGAERVSFLHGLTTQDIKGLAVGRATYTAILTPKGKMIADARLLALGDALLLETEPERAAPAADFLSHHLISEDAEVVDASGSLAMLSLLGPRAMAAAALALSEEAFALEENQIEQRGELVAVGARLGAVPVVDLFAPPAQARALFADALERGRSIGLVPVGADALEIARVEAGLPRFGPDMDEETIPLEANLGERAISFNKGCYVGQEVIARATFRGGVRRKLAGLSLEPGPLPAPGTALFAQGAADARAAAEVTSTVLSPRYGPIALAYVRREHLAPGTVLATAEGRRATVCALPFEAPR